MSLCSELILLPRSAVDIFVSIKCIDSWERWTSFSCTSADINITNEWFIDAKNFGYIFFFSIARTIKCEESEDKYRKRAKKGRDLAKPWPPVCKEYVWMSNISDGLNHFHSKIAGGRIFLHGKTSEVKQKKNWIMKSPLIVVYNAFYWMEQKYLSFIMLGIVTNSIRCISLSSFFTDNGHCKLYNH